MIEVNIAGVKSIQISNLVLDYNGTLAIDGRLISGVEKKLNELSNYVEIYVVTADTFGSAKENLIGVNCSLTVLNSGAQDVQKFDFLKKLGADQCMAIGNGMNDRLMLKEAGLGVLVIQEEGAAAESLASSDIITKDILSALSLLESPERITATLRK